MVLAPSIKVLRVRIKDKHDPVLRQMAIEANQVWNFCNALSERMIRERGRWMTGFDLQKYTNGASSEFDLIGSATVQQMCEEFAAKRRAAKRTKLKFRRSFDGHRPRDLGWVPFKARAARWKCGQVVFAGQHLRVWDSYGLAGYDFRGGCFTEDARGRWYLCICVATKPKVSSGQDRIGIDLGLKTTATCSDGTTLSGTPYRDLEPALAVAQRARKKQRVRAIHAKIRNRRSDAQHKFSSALVARCGEIHVGNVGSGKLIKTRMAKSVHDAGWSSLRTMLEYKCRQAGIVYSVMNEAHTTVTCSSCEARSGPKGVEGLRVRHWECGGCGARHDRDVNAARNILRVAAGHGRPAEGIPGV